MQTEENKKIAWRWLDLISEHKIEEICELVAPDWEMHGGPPDLRRGAEGVRTLFHSIGKVRQTWTIEDTIAEGDKVVVRATNTCEQESFFRRSGARHRPEIYGDVYPPNRRRQNSGYVAQRR